MKIIKECHRALFLLSWRRVWKRPNRSTIRVIFPFCKLKLLRNVTEPLLNSNAVYIYIPVSTSQSIIFCLVDEECSIGQKLEIWSGSHSADENDKGMSQSLSEILTRFHFIIRFRRGKIFDLVQLTKGVEMVKPVHNLGHFPTLQIKIVKEYHRASHKCWRRFHS